MASLEKHVTEPVVIPGQITYTLDLDETEAGYLLELLRSHVAGSLVAYGQPLNRVSDALREGGVQMITAYNSNRYRDNTRPHSCLYATEAEARGAF